jgi:hypothetical protein
MICECPNCINEEDYKGPVGEKMREIEIVHPYARRSDLHKALCELVNLARKP